MRQVRTSSTPGLVDRRLIGAPCKRTSSVLGVHCAPHLYEALHKIGVLRELELLDDRH
ncbi:hypothetical protein LCGC14_2782580, partial [marine sediment metagenome]